MIARRSAAGAAAVLAGVLATSGCAAGAGDAAGELTVTADGEAATTLALDDVRCLESAEMFTASSSERTEGPPSFVATETSETGVTVTWLKLAGDDWFMTTEPFDRADGRITFDQAQGEIGVGTSDEYPTVFERSAVLSGTITCSTQTKV